MPCTRLAHPEGDSRTSQLLQQNERLEYSVNTGSCSSSPESAGPPLAPSAVSPCCEPVASNHTASSVSLGTEMRTQANRSVALSKERVSNSEFGSDGCSSNHDDQVDNDADDQIESFEVTDRSAPDETLHTPPRSVCLQQGQPCRPQSPSGQVPPHVSAYQVSVDRATPVVSRADLQSPPSESTWETKSPVEPGFCVLGCRSSDTAVQLGTAVGGSSEAETGQHGLVSGCNADMLHHPAMQAASHCGSSLEPATGLSAPRVGSSCAATCLPLPDVQASPANALAPGSAVTPRSLQPPVAEAEQASSSGHYSGRNSDAPPGSLLQIAPHDIQPSPTTGDILLTPQLFLASSQGCARDPALAASPSGCTPAEHIRTSALADAGVQAALVQSVHPRGSLWCPRSHMAGEYRRAKARASVSYGRHSALPLSQTPHEPQTPGTAPCVARPRASVRASATPWRRSQLAPPDAHCSPGLGRVEAIPEGSDGSGGEEGAPGCPDSPEVLFAVEQALQACGQVGYPCHAQTSVPLGLCTPSPLPALKKLLLS